MNDAPDATSPIALKHSTDLVRLGKVANVHVNVRAIFFRVGSVRGQTRFRQLSDADEGFRVGIVVVVDGDDLVSPCLLQDMDDVRP